MITKIMKIGVVIVLVLGLAGTGFAQKGKQEVKPEVKEKNIIKSVTKEITGEVSGISKNFIAVVYKREKGVESEMANIQGGNKCVNQS